MIVAGLVDQLDLGIVDRLVDARTIALGRQFLRPAYDVELSLAAMRAGPRTQKIATPTGEALRP
jgi:hypothetical protein